MTKQYPPQCPDHTRLPIRLEEIKKFYAETGTLIKEDMDYLIGQAAWAIELDNAGQNLKNAATAYIDELQTENSEQAQEIEELRDNLSNLRNIIDNHAPEEA